MLKKLLFILLIPVFTFTMDDGPGERHDRPMSPMIRAQFQGMRVGRLAREIRDTSNLGWAPSIWMAYDISRHEQGWTDWGMSLLPAAIGMVVGYNYRDRHTTDTVDDPTPEQNNSEQNNSEQG